MSSTPHDITAKKRVLDIFRLLIESPGFYTKRKLAELYGISPDTITRDFEDIKNAGFELRADQNYRYYLTAEKTTELIKDLMLITDLEKSTISNALEGKVTDSEKQRIINKLETLTNLPRIGNIIFTKPYLAKTNILFKAKKEKQKVVLFNYRSTNSNTHNDRTIEPFHISVEEDILHAFDLERNEIRHYRISRIDRIQQLDDDWENEGKHNIIATDIFKIADKNQVPVHVRLKIGGYNELIERYPLAKAALTPAPDKEDEYDLICKVNHRFYGLQNFLLGYAHYVVEIVENEILRKHMAEKIKQISF